MGTILQTEGGGSHLGLLFLTDSSVMQSVWTFGLCGILKIFFCGHVSGETSEKTAADQTDVHPIPYSVCRSEECAC